MKMPASESPSGKAAPGATALVTGAGKRIGRVIAQRLAREGFSIAIHYNRSEAEAAELAAAIVAGGGRAHVVTANLADAAAVETIMPSVHEALGPVTLLVNCASAFIPDDALALEGSTFDLHFAVNLRAPIFLAGEFARRLPADADGCIINIIDQRVWKLTPQFFSYTLTKSALWTATRTLAQALAPRIRVNAVGPGPTLENIYDGPDGLAKEAANVPLRRPAPPDDVAEAVVYLVGARSVTGQMIAVDSGQHLGWETPDITAFYSDDAEEQEHG